jgi:U2 small nuclear ribonucleoprotein A'
MQNFFECIDFSDNEIRKLANFSYLDRLTSLILTNNRIKHISDLSETLPNIENIFLMNNKISDLQEIYKLATCTKLQRLVLINNSITEGPNYRLNVIARIPSLRVLDFCKITKEERKEAEKIVNLEESKK